MAQFKQIPQSYMARKITEFWFNMIQNFDEEIRDSDFFAIVAKNVDQSRIVSLVQAAFTPEEIEKMKEGRYRQSRLDLTDGSDDILMAIWNHSEYRSKTRLLMGAVKKVLMQQFSATHVREDIENRLEELWNTFHLNDVEREVMLVTYLVGETCFCWPRRIDNGEKPVFIAMAINRSYAEVQKALSPSSNLRKFLVVDNDFDFNGRTYCGFLTGADAEAFESRFYQKSSSETLPWSFYGDLAETDGAVLKKMFASVNGKLNILLYGVPGTGKTSFARSLAAELGRTAYEVRQGDDNGRNSNADFRMAGIRVCSEQLDAAKSVVIVDEADELLRGGGMNLFVALFGASGGKSTEKGVMNNLLDEVKIPVIWISNTPAEAMDESVRRRFDYSICFEELNGAQREAIWRNSIRKLDLGGLIPDSSVKALAAKYATSAGGIAQVLENVKRINPAPADVETLIAELMKPHCRLMGIEERQKFLPAKDYSLEGLNIQGKVKLDRIVTAVKNYYRDGFAAAGEDRPRMNLLLWGPPGTGKTEFVKYLSKTLGRKVLVRMGSDLLSKWVGESEKNIAAAFRQAEREHAILFLDEIDGLVQSRGTAHASWQVTQVNEILHQMENFNGVMVAATNFFDNLDPAILRRFTFKLQFGYLDEAGKKLFFERMFKTTLTDEEAAELAAIKNLAPGDFRTVRQGLYYLGDAADNADRLSALREESSVKKDDPVSTSHIGF